MYLALLMSLNACTQVKPTDTPQPTEQTVAIGEELPCSVKEHHYLREVLGHGPYDPSAGHDCDWLKVDSTGNMASIAGTPYRLRYVYEQQEDVWKLFLEDEQGTRIELPIFGGAQKAPFAAYGAQALNGASTVVYLAPNADGVVVDPYYLADHEECGPLYITWRDGTPKLSEPIRCRAALKAPETDERMVGWKDNTPVTCHYNEVSGMLY